MISKFQAGLKSLLRQWLSEPEFYGDLVYKLKTIAGSNNFSTQFSEIISPYKKIGYDINVLQQTACLLVNPITVATLLSSLIARRWVGLQTLWRFRLKDLSIDEMVGVWSEALTVCLAHRGLPVGFLLLQYSVLFTVQSLSLPYLFFISWFICSGRWCIDKLGVLYANQTSMCFDPHLNLGFFFHIFSWPFQCGVSFVDHLCYFCLVFVMLSSASVY